MALAILTVDVVAQYIAPLRLCHIFPIHHSFMGTILGWPKRMAKAVITNYD